MNLAVSCLANRKELQLAVEFEAGWLWANMTWNKKVTPGKSRLAIARLILTQSKEKPCLEPVGTLC